ncbi:hypothetical protein HPB51_025174 [Rhipicephalus microplus]|uniref:Uncharacterized protein n=1 Tax=Rhipicephalus microplus TaxID=6941 RepID=A0A9J6E4T0_RHIMP|nr:hypothetical protein HPB51_025174 [Rhipicephalus microplus]
MPEEGNDDSEDGEDTEDCESLLVEVHELQREGIRKLNFGTFRDVYGDVVTSPDFSDTAIVATVAPHPEAKVRRRVVSKWTTTPRYPKLRGRQQKRFNTIHIIDALVLGKVPVKDKHYEER